MSEALPSLIIEQELRDSQQMPLFSIPDKEAEEKLCVSGIYTAERLFSRRPDTYRTIVHLLGQGNSVRAIKRACNVHHSTIQAVAARERIAIDTGKEKVLADMRMAQTMLVESLVEDIAENRLKPEAKPLAVAILTDKIELLSGGVTQRIETTQTSDGPKTWDEWKERALKVVEIRDVTGLGGEKDGQRAPAALDAPARVHLLNLPAADSESAAVQSNGGSATDGAPDRAVELIQTEALDQGGRGSEFSTGGGVERTD